MNKLFILKSLLFIFILNFSSIAQTEKGNFLIGLSLSPSIKNNNAKVIEHLDRTITSSSTLVSLESNMKAGYFLFNNFCLGLNPQISLLKQKNEEFIQSHHFANSTQPGTTIANKTSTQIFSINPFLRLYGIRKNKIGIFIEASGGISAIRQHYTGNISIPSQGSLPANGYFITKTTGNYKIGLGANYFITEKVGIELLLDYQKYNIDHKMMELGNIYKNNLSAYLGFSIFI